VSRVQTPTPTYNMQCLVGRKGWGVEVAAAFMSVGGGNDRW